MTPSALQILQAQPELTKNSGVEVDRVALCLPEVGCDVDARRLWGMKPGYLAIRAAVSTVAFRRGESVRESMREKGFRRKESPSS